MTRDYFIKRRSADIDRDPDGEHYLARTVYEEYELIDTGVVDHNGDKIMARRKMEPIGFVRFKDRS